MDQLTIFLMVIIFMAYFFDYINGFHDAANSIATIVATGVLSPFQAVLWAALFNFIAFLFFNLMVANTIGKGLIAAEVITPTLIFAALSGAILWNLFTWFFGIPSSSSHALIGGLAGAAIAKGGIGTLIPAGFIKVGFGIFISPVLGLLLGLLVCWIFVVMVKGNTNRKTLKFFKKMQLISSALLSLTHGGNDAQKTMGIISVLLFSSGWLQGEFYVPFWVVISCQFMISLGTLAGGWRIVKTMGHNITELNPLRGCAAETGAAVTIYFSTWFGIPVSTTQTVTGAIAGVGLLEKRKGPNWAVLRVIFYSWLITLPAAGGIAALLMSVVFKEFF